MPAFTKNAIFGAINRKLKKSQHQKMPAKNSSSMKKEIAAAARPKFKITLQKSGAEPDLMIPQRRNHYSIVAITKKLSRLAAKSICVVKTN
jgi:hypothetical protein